MYVIKVSCKMVRNRNLLQFKLGIRDFEIRGTLLTATVLIIKIFKIQFKLLFVIQNLRKRCFTSTILWIPKILFQYLILFYFQRLCFCIFEQTNVQKPRETLWVEIRWLTEQMSRNFVYVYLFDWNEGWMRAQQNWMYEPNA